MSLLIISNVSVLLYFYKYPFDIKNTTICI